MVHSRQIQIDFCRSVGLDELWLSDTNRLDWMNYGCLILIGARGSKVVIPVHRKLLLRPYVDDWCARESAQMTPVHRRAWNWKKM